MSLLIVLVICFTAISIIGVVSITKLFMHLNKQLVTLTTAQNIKNLNPLMMLPSASSSEIEGLLNPRSPRKEKGEAPKKEEDDQEKRGYTHI